MSNGEVGSITLLLLVMLSAAHVFGHLFVRLRQPRVIGEILAGVLLGPSVLGRLAPQWSAPVFGRLLNPNSHHTTVLNFVYWLGLLLLMFVSGNETRRLFAAQDRRETAWLAALGTGLPFVLFLLISPWLPVGSVIGPAANRTALILVLGIAVAVTSIPVISRIFYDLKILHTRFASLVLGVAVLEDIGLWAVLAVATALAASTTLPRLQMAKHVAATMLYFAVGMTLAPAVLRALHRSRWNVIAKASPAAYVLGVLFTYTTIAAPFDISLVFAAFLAGFALRDEMQLLGQALDSISRIAFALFIPVYFATVGFRLDLAHSFSFRLAAVFFGAACLMKVASVLLGARLAGFRGLDAVNLAVAFNARGGPGIVLASVAYDAKIVNATMYTTLVLLAVLTSQAAGAWLEFVLRKGWPLLSGETAPVSTMPKAGTATDEAAA